MAGIALWRLTRSKHARRASLAEGSRLAGGRWNPQGSAVVYTGSSISLVALEYFVHLSGRAPADLVLLRLRVERKRLLEDLDRKALRADWQNRDSETQRLGQQWLDGAQTLGLRVPSALVPEEANVVLNPAHPEWQKVEMEIVRRFSFDPRMYKA